MCFEPLLPSRRWLFAGLAALVFAVARAGPAAASDELAAKLAKPGHIAMMRHALAPGTGDPANFTLGDCATQRNLSEAGRRQARRTGDFLRSVGVSEARVFSSQWCRCMDTAELLELGAVEPLPALNSFFRDRAGGPEQTRQLREKIGELDLSQPVLMVTHQVNITGLTDVFPSSGEIVVLRREADGDLAVLGTVDPRSTQ
ncbi:histidine phosphatase family protein [Dichotomicrobium thermohalophilum]|uniref:Histidine phosphatase superfamily protein (Branch 1) n=1 Tax=Dichotomicrobium thermohalophilum TaxID=933063 RepID=A0A397PNX8_9HYPH|nr:histidine phosphatase family protein [Dichotomicrobium thermohalophilum]RIA47744.1 histidine phosphatase superfamily protein (branch 1) [Dichotomicrobium thermohalophilum]